MNEAIEKETVDMELPKPGDLYITQYGSEVELLSYPDKDGWVRVKRLSDGANRDWNLSQMRKSNIIEKNKQ